MQRRLSVLTYNNVFQNYVFTERELTYPTEQSANELGNVCAGG